MTIDEREKLPIVASVHELATNTEEQEEPEDQKEKFEAECAQTSECRPVKARLDSCTERVTGAAEGTTDETCVEEFFDLMHCIHNCVCFTPSFYSSLLQAPEKLFHVLK